MKKRYVIDGRWFLAVLVTMLGLAARPSPAAAQAQIIQSFTLREIVALPIAGRDGEWVMYLFPGSPYPFGNLGAGFAVDQVCFPSDFGGVFLSAGQGFGDMVALTPTGSPFAAGEVDPTGRTELCNPEADDVWWFAYGNSLNNSPLLAGRFFGNDDEIQSAACDTVPTPREGIFFLERRSADRQVFDLACENRDPNFPLRLGTALICSFTNTWLDSVGQNLQPLLRSCERYLTCTSAPVGPVVARGLGCGQPTPPPGGSTASVSVSVTNATGGQPLSGAAVSFPGGPTQTTDAAGTTIFTNVPAGAPITFTATASGFAPGSAAVTPIAGSTTPLTIPLAPVVTCNDTQVAGGDTPDTRVVDLGQTAGTFQFDFETFSQADQIVVSYEGGILFDTSCVGAGGTQPLSYSGSSTGVTVQVFPNCAGGTGTQWTYTVHCP